MLSVALRHIGDTVASSKQATASQMTLTRLNAHILAAIIKRRLPRPWKVGWTFTSGQTQTMMLPHLQPNVQAAAKISAFLCRGCQVRWAGKQNCWMCGKMGVKLNGIWTGSGDSSGNPVTMGEMLVTGVEGPSTG